MGNSCSTKKGGSEIEKEAVAIPVCIMGLVDGMYYGAGGWYVLLGWWMVVPLCVTWKLRS